MPFFILTITFVFTLTLASVLSFTSGAYAQPRNSLPEQFVLAIDIDDTLLGDFYSKEAVDREGVEVNSSQGCFLFDIGGNTYDLADLSREGIVLMEDKYRELFKKVGELESEGIKVYILFITYGLYELGFADTYLDFIGYKGARRGKVTVINRRQLKEVIVPEYLKQYCPLGKYTPKFYGLNKQLIKWDVIQYTDDVIGNECCLLKALSSGVNLKPLSKSSVAMMFIDDLEKNIEGYKYFCYLVNILSYNKIGACFCCLDWKNSKQCEIKIDDAIKNISKLGRENTINEIDGKERLKYDGQSISSSMDDAKKSTMSWQTIGGIFTPVVILIGYMVYSHLGRR